VKNFLNAIRTGEKLAADIESGIKAHCWCNLGNIAQRTGHSLTVDPQNGHILNDQIALALWSREYEKDGNGRVILFITHFHQFPCPQQAVIQVQGSPGLGFCLSFTPVPKRPRAFSSGHQPVSPVQSFSPRTCKEIIAFKFIPGSFLLRG